MKKLGLLLGGLILASVGVAYAQSSPNLWKVQNNNAIAPINGGWTVVDGSGNKYVTSTSGGGGAVTFNGITTSTQSIKAGAGVGVVSSTDGTGQAIITITSTGGSSSTLVTGVSPIVVSQSGVNATTSCPTCITSAVQTLFGLSTSSISISTGTQASTFTVTSTGGNTIKIIIPSNIAFFTNDAGYLTGNQTITLTGAVTGSGATSIATTYTTSTLYSLFSGSGPITFNTSTGGISFTNPGYISAAITSINGNTTAAQTFTAGAGISVASAGGNTTTTNTGVTSVIAGGCVTVSNATGTVTFGSTCSTLTTSTLNGLYFQIGNNLSESTNTSTLRNNIGFTFAATSPITVATTSAGATTYACATCLTANQSITWTGTGDVTGSASGATTISVPLTTVKIQGKNVTSTAPTDHQILSYIGANSDWEPANMVGGTNIAVTTSTASSSSLTVGISGVIGSANGGTATTTALGACAFLSTCGSGGSGGTATSSPVTSGTIAMFTGTAPTITNSLITQTSSQIAIGSGSSTATFDTSTSSPQYYLQVQDKNGNNLFALASTTITTASSVVVTNGLTTSFISGTQCVHAVSGVISGTGADCGVGAGTVTTSSAGVANTLPIWTSGSALGNSVVTQNGTSTFINASSVYAGTNASSGTYQFTSTASTTKNYVEAGSSTVAVTIGGTLAYSATSTGTSGSASTSIENYKIATSTFLTIGDEFDFYSGGTITNSAGAKRIQLAIGSTTVFDTNSGSGVIPINTAGNWFSETRCTANTTSVLLCASQFTDSANSALTDDSGDAGNATTSISFTSSTQINIFGIGGASNDLTANYFRVMWNPF